MEADPGVDTALRLSNADGAAASPVLRGHHRDTACTFDASPEAVAWQFPACSALGLLDRPGSVRRVQRLECELQVPAGFVRPGDAALPALTGFTVAPCHALQGRGPGQGRSESGVGSGRTEGKAGDTHEGVRTRRPNKGMKLTKGGWSWGAASWSAAARSVGIVRRPRRSRPSQLIPGVRPTSVQRGDGHETRAVRW